MERTRHYHLALTDWEREEIARGLRELPRSGLKGRAPGIRRALADRIDREHGKEDLLSLATSRLRAWYYGRVRDIAADCLSEILAGRIDGTEGLDTWIHETIDGTDIVVYTYKAKAALLASDNESAYEEIYGGEPASAEVRAFYALEADVREQLKAEVAYRTPGEAPLPEGFDLSDASTWTRDSDAGLEEVAP